MDKRIEVDNSKYSSISYIFLCLFTISMYFSPKYFFGDAFDRLPLIFSILTLISHVVSSLINRKPIFQWSRAACYLVVVYLFAAIATYGVTVDQDNSKEIFYEFSRAIILFFLITNIISTRNELKYYLVLIASLGAGIAYRLVHYPIYMNKRVYFEGSTLFGIDPNIVCIMFVYSIPIIIALMLLTKSKLLRVILLYFLFECLLGFSMTQSRGGFLAVLCISCMWLKDLKGKNRLLAAVVLLIFSTLFLYRYAPPSYFYRMREIVSPMDDSTGSAQARSTAMIITLKYVITHPFSEFGLGNHGYLIADKLGHSPPREELFRGSFLVHNLFLHYGADTGFVPMVFYILFTYSLFASITRSRQHLVIGNNLENRELKIIIIALKLSLFGFLVGAFFLAWAYYLYLFFLGGVCMAACKIVQQEHGPKSMPLATSLDFEPTR